MKYKAHKLAGLLAAIGLASMVSVRARTTDVAFTYRMGAGMPGDINRTNPFSVLPAFQNATTPVKLVGDPCYVNTADGTIKGFTAGDTALTRIYGVFVRSFPTQQQTGGMSSAIGQGAAPTSGPQDVLRQGFIMVKLPPGAAVTKDGAVFIWCAATAGNNIQGGFVGAASGGNTAAIANARFTGPADANGIAEVEVWAS